MEFTLKQKQINQLIHLRNHKKSFHLKAFGGFMVMFIFAFFPLSSFFFTEYNSGNWFARHKLQLISIPLFVLIMYKLIDYFFIKTLMPLKRDIKSRIGIIEKHQIMRKQFFPLTNEHYFFFAEKEIPNIPVDVLTFQHYQAGDYFTIHKAKYSKVIFEDILREEINTEYDFEETVQCSMMDHF